MISTSDTVVENGASRPGIEMKGGRKDTLQSTNGNKNEFTDALEQLGRGGVGDGEIVAKPANVLVDSAQQAQSDEANAKLQLNPLQLALEALLGSPATIGEGAIDGLPSSKKTSADRSANPAGQPFSMTAPAMDAISSLAASIIGKLTPPDQPLNETARPALPGLPAALQMDLKNGGGETVSGLIKAVLQETHFAPVADSTLASNTNESGATLASLPTTPANQTAAPVPASGLPGTLRASPQLPLADMPQQQPTDAPQMQREQTLPPLQVRQSPAVEGPAASQSSAPKMQSTVPQQFAAHAAPMADRATTVAGPIMKVEQQVDQPPASPIQQLLSAIQTESVTFTEASLQQTGPANPTNFAMAPVKVLKIELHPAELGTVTARLSIKDDVVHVHIEAARQETADILGRDHDTLTRALHSAGLVLDGMSVTTSASGAAQPANNFAPANGGSNFPGASMGAEAGTGGQNARSGNPQHSPRADETGSLGTPAPLAPSNIRESNGLYL